MLQANSVATSVSFLFDNHEVVLDHMETVTGLRISIANSEDAFDTSTSAILLQPGTYCVV